MGNAGDSHITRRELGLRTGNAMAKWQTAVERKGEVRMHGTPERREGAMLRYSWITILAILIAATLGGPYQASAQVLYGSLVGNVTDANGAVVPAAAVTVIDQ